MPWGVAKKKKRDMLWSAQVGQGAGGRFKLVAEWTGMSMSRKVPVNPGNLGSVDQEMGLLTQEMCVWGHHNKGQQMGWQLKQLTLILPSFWRLCI